MKKFLLAACLAAFFIVSSLSRVNAHESFHWMQRVEKENMLVVFYDLDDFKANVEQAFQAKFVRLENGKTIPFTKADISFETNGRRVYSFSKKPTENNDVSFYYSFPQNGKYVLSVKLMDGSKQLIEAQFPILVGEGIDATPKTFFQNYAVNIVLGFLVILAIGYIAGMKHVDAFVVKKINGALKKSKMQKE